MGASTLLAVVTTNCAPIDPGAADRGPQRSCEELSPRNGGSETKAGRTQCPMTAGSSP
jgi:hypothetical protein